MSDKNDKHGIKPYDASKMKFDIVTSDDKGNPMYLPPDQDTLVKTMINRMAPQQVPVGGMIFVPEKKYKDIQNEINRGYLFGNKISTGRGSEENFQMGGDALGDGFSLPQYRRTYLNAALLKNPKKLEAVMAHELGHNAAWLSDPKNPDFSERGADEFKDAMLKRSKDVLTDVNDASKGALSSRVIQSPLQAQPAGALAGDPTETKDSPLNGTDPQPSE